MTDPLRRDPTEFLRTLKKMTSQSSWQKCLLFASRGRMIGFKLGIQHYNTILFSQCLWGRALEIVKVIRAMEEDDVRPNGVSYYYICNGMANADHGHNVGFNMNFQLEGLQHWRVASNALMACEHNGYDPSDSMYNSCIISATIPVMNQWKHACAIFNKMVEEERTPHPQMIEFFAQCLQRNGRPREAVALLKYASENNVKGYCEDDSKMNFKDYPDVFKHIPNWDEENNNTISSKSKSGGSGSEALIRKLIERTRKQKEQELIKNDKNVRSSIAAQEGKNTEKKISASSSIISEEEKQEILRQLKIEREVEAEKNLEEEEELEALRLHSGGTHDDAKKEFRPRVYRGLWWKWNAIANRYRPKESLRRKQLAPRHSPSGIPGFKRI